MGKQTLNKSDYQKIKQFQNHLKLDEKITTFLYFGITKEIEDGSYDPKLLKGDINFGGYIFKSIEIKKFTFELKEKDYFRRVAPGKETGNPKYFFHNELINYVDSGNTEYLEIFIEKNSLLNKANRWFQRSFHERVQNLPGIIIDSTNDCVYDSVLKLITDAHTSIHFRVATIFLIGAHLEGVKSLNISSLLSMSVEINSIRIKLLSNWSDPEHEVYKCRILNPSSIVNNKVISIGLHPDFLIKINLKGAANFTTAINSKMFNLIKPDDIDHKKLIYPEDLTGRIERYISPLSGSSFPEYLKSMKRKKLPECFSLMLYGESGVGKTELVMQIAKKINRPVLKVNLAELRTMWYGESERLVQQLFSDIRQASTELEIEPIVLFNEADGFFHSRSDHSYKIETGLNIITIFLNELENFNGIIFATSNYTNTIDPAFERRFILKIHIPSPDNKALHEIIKEKLSITDKGFIDDLVRKYNITPAELDNVKQKSIILNIGPDQPKEIEELIREEHLGWNMKTRRNHIGFN